jgi:hypothetical protein
MGALPREDPVFNLNAMSAEFVADDCRIHRRRGKAAPCPGFEGLAGWRTQKNFCAEKTLTRG